MEKAQTAKKTSKADKRAIDKRKLQAAKNAALAVLQNRQVLEDLAKR